MLKNPLPLLFPLLHVKGIDLTRQALSEGDTCGTAARGRTRVVAERFRLSSYQKRGASQDGVFWSSSFGVSAKKTKPKPTRYESCKCPDSVAIMLIMLPAAYLTLSETSSTDTRPGLHPPSEASDLTRKGSAEARPLCGKRRTARPGRGG